MLNLTLTFINNRCTLAADGSQLIAHPIDVRGKPVRLHITPGSQHLITPITNMLKRDWGASNVIIDQSTIQ